MRAQEDIGRGRDMVDSLFTGGAAGVGGTHNAIMSSSDYLTNASRDFNNIEEGFYISPAFLDKLTIHVAKNFMDLPKIKVPLILGIWGGKGQGKTFQVRSGLVVPCGLHDVLVLSTHPDLLLCLPSPSTHAARVVLARLQEAGNQPHRHVRWRA